MEGLFTHLDEDEKKNLLKHLEASIINFSENINFYSMVKEVKIIGYIESGCIEIIRNNPNGSRTIIEELVENDIFGYTISSDPGEEFEFITKTKTKVIVMDYKKIMQQQPMELTSYSQMMRNLFELTAKKIKEKNEHIEILTKKTIRDKLLEYFRITSFNNRHKVIDLPFTYTELAEYLAVDRSAMSREIKMLKDEGFIAVKGRKITLLY